MTDISWYPEFSARLTPSGNFAPVVLLFRSGGEGCREASWTYAGEYPSASEAASAARRQYSGDSAPAGDSRSQA